VDAVVCCGYKWLLSPRGAAWMAVRQDYAETMVARSAGWYGGESPWDTIYGLPLRQAPDGRRFDTSPAWFCYLGAAAVLPELAALDPAELYAHCAGLGHRVGRCPGRSRAGRPRRFAGEHPSGPGQARVLSLQRR
jgi:selenocysteine lyase/cysteine desulfurase